jgi:hypothetical protein
MLISGAMKEFLKPQLRASARLRGARTLVKIFTPFVCYRRKKMFECMKKGLVVQNTTLSVQNIFPCIKRYDIKGQKNGSH